MRVFLLGTSAIFIVFGDSNIRFSTSRTRSAAVVLDRLGEFHSIARPAPFRVLGVPALIEVLLRGSRKDELLFAIDANEDLIRKTAWHRLGPPFPEMGPASRFG
jgi:hypothetical protein